MSGEPMPLGSLTYFTVHDHGDRWHHTCQSSPPFGLAYHSVEKAKDDAEAFLRAEAPGLITRYESERIVDGTTTIERGPDFVAFRCNTEQRARVKGPERKTVVDDVTYTAPGEETWGEWALVTETKQGGLWENYAPKQVPRVTEIYLTIEETTIPWGDE